MNGQALGLSIRRGSRPKHSFVFNDLSARLFRHAPSIHTDVSSAATNGNIIAVTDDVKVKAGGNQSFSAENIIIGDLAATLDAHRASNRTKAARISVAPPPNNHGQRHDVLGRETSDEISTGETFHGPELSTPEKASGDLDLGPAKPGSLFRHVRLRPQTLSKSSPSKVESRIEYKKEQGEIEYEARIGRTQGQWSQKIVRGPQVWRSHRPWLAYVDSPHEDRLDRLSSEIRGLEAYMRLTPTEEKSARLIISDALPVLGADTTSDQIELLGSRGNGLATPMAYFGFVIPNQGPLVTGDTQSWKALQNILNDALRRTEERLQASSDFRDIRRVHASIPIVKAMHNRSGSMVEFQTMNELHASQAQIRAWQKETSSLRPLFLTLRLFLETLDLNKVFDGGLNSYTLIAMIVTALKHANDAHDPGDLGEQLLHVLDFWSNAHLSKYAYSVVPPFVYSKTELTAAIRSEGGDASHAQGLQVDCMRELCLRARHQPSSYLCLQDPTDHRNNLGFQCRVIKHIQAVFRKAHQKLLNFIETGKHSHPEGLSKGERISGHRETRSVLCEIIQADFTAFERQRSRLDRHVHPKRRPARANHLFVKQISLDQQMRALDHRQRHGLPPLLPEPCPYLPDWEIALGLTRIENGGRGRGKNLIRLIDI